MTIGEIIREYRNERGLSQREFSRICGLSHASIALFEKGFNPKTGQAMIPTLTNMKKMADGMGISLQELLDKCDDMEVALADAAAYRGTNPRIAELVEKISDFSAKELNEMLSYADWVVSRR